ncbi:MAG: hypothetical protein Q8K36_05100 [Alphaproteobacteria bacterium]|nr:hypothetical protein [Alphaproteobacteria bacterium]
MGHFCYLVLACVTLMGCESVINNHGYNNDNADISFIQVNKTTIDEVYSALGSPTTITPHALNNPKWRTVLYISKKTSTTSFFKPVVLSQHSLVIVIDEKDIVRDIKKVEGDTTEDPEPNPDATEISSYEESVSRGVFGSFGRQLNSSPKKK